MFTVVDVITRDRINNNGTVRLYKADGLTTFLDGGQTRPCIDGDVLSITPEGNAIGRPAGTNGIWEQNLVTDKGLLFNPNQKDGVVNGKQFLVAYVD